MYVGIAVFSGITLFLLTLAVVYLTIKKWDPALRLAAAKKFRVEIEVTGKGQWQVIDPIAWHKRLGIELLQLALYLFLFFLWSFAAMTIVVMLAFLEKALTI